jgi:hypothetical protein
LSIKRPSSGEAVQDTKKVKIAKKTQPSPTKKEESISMEEEKQYSEMMKKGGIAGEQSKN